MFFQIRDSHTTPLSFQNFVTSLIKMPLKTAFLLANLLKDYWLVYSIAGSNFFLSHTLIILDGQILVS